MAPMNSIFPNRLWKIHSFCRDSLSLVCGKWHRWILWKSSVRFLYSFQCFMPIKVFGQITSCRFQGCLWYVTCSCFSETSLFPHIKRRFWIENWGGRYILRSASKKTKNQNLSLPPPPPTPTPSSLWCGREMSAVFSVTPSRKKAFSRRGSRHRSHPVLLLLFLTDNWPGAVKCYNFPLP